MEQISVLLELVEKFKERLPQVPPAKQLAAVNKAIRALNTCLQSIEPTQKELKQELLTNKEAMKIRTLWDGIRKSVDLPRMAKEMGLTVKKPSLDHILLGYYYPQNRLRDLVQKFETIAASDPARAEIARFQQWRGELRALRSHPDVEEGVKRLVAAQGVDIVRRFAAHLSTKDSSGKRKLPKTARVDKLIEAVAAQLWKERLISRAQEGAL